MLDVAYDWLFPDVVLDCLNALDELIDEVEAAVSGLANGETSLDHQCADWKLEQKKGKENQKTVESGSASDLSGHLVLQYGTR